MPRQKVCWVTPALVVALLAWFSYRAWALPIAAAEAYGYDRFVRPPLRETLVDYDLHNYVVYTLLAKRSVGLFRLSEFSLRLPSLLGGALYFWAVCRLARRWLRRPLWLAAAVMTLAAPVTLPGCFDAWGYGLSLGLWMFALERMWAGNWNLGGVCLSLSVAANLWFALPAAVLVAVWLRHGWVAVDRVFLPALVTTFILLVIPLSHAHGAGNWRVPLSRQDDTALRSLVEALRDGAGFRHVTIGASPSVEPSLNFYRARYRRRNWERVAAEAGAGPFDYYVLAPGDARLVELKHLRVLLRDGEFLLAR